VKLIVELHGQEGEMDVTGGCTPEELMNALGLHPDVTLAFLEGRPVPLDHPLPEGGRVKLVVAASGG